MVEPQTGVLSIGATNKEELANVTSDRTEIKNSAPAVAEFPEAADLLNQLKTQRKKSRADLVDIEVILEILETDRSEI